MNGQIKMGSTHSQGLFDDTMNKHTHLKVCALHECCKEFVPKRRWQRFCSRECKDRYWQLLREAAMKIVRERYET